MKITILVPLTAMAVIASNAAAAEARRVTAREVLERIQKNTGVQWRSETVDTLKAGDPGTQITGIATTFIVTLDVLERAAASGKNLIITHEPTFYNHLDKTDDLKGDSVLAAKQAFIEKHGLIIWRFHDHWHARRPDGIISGMTEALGWEKYKSAKDERLFVLPETTLDRLAADIRTRLKLRTLRVVGEPQMKVSRVGLAPGSPGSAPLIKALQRDDVEVLLAGETSEWQVAEYVRDAVTAGKRKALILLGHVVSEEGGMENCARWLRTFVSEVPVGFIPAREPLRSAA